MRTLNTTEVNAVSGGGLLSSTIGNALIIGSNTVNGFFDLVSPLGLLGNRLLGSGFATVHYAGDYLIGSASNLVTSTGTALGGTVPVKSTHLTNEWGVTGV
jgi:hypothetical protein